MSKKIYINASCLRDASCRRALRYRICNSYTEDEFEKPEGLELIGDKLAMFWGSCFHKFLQQYYTNGDYNLGIKLAQEKFDAKGIEPDDRYNLATLESVAMRYTVEYKGDKLKVLTCKTGGTFVEKLFCFPFYEDDDFQIFLFGKIDLIALYFGEVSIIDHKTTANAYPESFLKDYNLNQQVFFYKYICWKYAKLFPAEAGFLENAKFIINGIFLSKKVPLFIRRDYIISEQEIIEFEDSLDTLVTEFITYLKKNPDHRDGIVKASCANRRYGKCDFWQLCEDRTDEVTLRGLEGVCYKKRIYDTTIHTEED